MGQVLFKGEITQNCINGVGSFKNLLLENHKASYLYRVGTCSSSSALIPIIMYTARILAQQPALDSQQNEHEKELRKLSLHFVNQISFYI
jgi:hypothetical protein